MGKKRKKDLGKVKTNIPHCEAYSRMNFLYQAANLTLATNPNNIELSRFYSATVKTIGAKLLCKMEPEIKRTICKYCHMILIPGVTSTVRLTARREKHISVMCLDCGRLKRFNTSKEHTLWTEKDFKVTEINANATKTDTEVQQQEDQKKPT